MIELDRLTGVFREVFGDDDLIITRKPKCACVLAWDSLMQVGLMIAVERAEN